MNLKYPKTLRKYKENFQPEMPEMKFSKLLIFTRAFKSYKLEILAVFLI